MSASIVRQHSANSMNKQSANNVYKQSEINDMYAVLQCMRSRSLTHKRDKVLQNIQLSYVGIMYLMLM